MEEIKKEKKKISKKVLGFVIVGVLALVLVSAALLVYYGKINQNVNVAQAVTLTGGACVNNICPESVSNAFSGDTKSSSNYKLANLASTIRYVKLTTSTTPWTPVGEIITTPIFKLTTIEGSYNETVGGPQVSYQDRVTVKSTDLLSEISSITFDYKTSDAYIPYLVLGIDTNDNGVYDTDGSDTNFVRSQAAGPANQWNTFTADSAWITSIQSTHGGHQVLQIKVMYGYWGGPYHEATALVKNIKVNGNQAIDEGLVLREVHSDDPQDLTYGDTIVDFYLENYFDTTGFSGTINTEFQPLE